MYFKSDESLRRLINEKETEVSGNNIWYKDNVLHEDNEAVLTKEAFRILTQESNNIFIIIKTDGTMVYMSDTIEKVTGFKPKEVLGKRIYDYFKGNELIKIKRMVENIFSNPNGKAGKNIALKSKDGKIIYLEGHMQNLADEFSMEYVIINLIDITKKVEMHKRMSQISTHDELTGLPNSIYFRKKLKLQYNKAAKTKISFAILMLDITGLKYINDALGYHFGDLVIAKVAEELKIHLNEKPFLCRYSGDRFAIITQTDTFEEYKNLADSIIDIFSKNIKVEKYEIDVNMSIGISIYNERENIQDIIRRAEIALFWAKKQGKNAYKFYSSDINIQNYKQIELHNDVGRVLENNELRIYYQPIVNLRTNELLAAEALVRWEHPHWGIIAPGEFISFAEETGFIINIGYWIFREVCRNYLQWINEGLPAIKMSVNISSIQFFENNFAQNIIDILNEFKLDPHFFIMEITESVFMLKANNVISGIKKLRAHGISVAIDDFGTGFSSLSYFKHFDIDYLKIDGLFVKKCSFR